VADLARRITGAGFVRPTLALAAATAALSVGVGFLPVAGATRGLGALATGAIVSLLAATAAVIQPLAGRARDRGRIGDRTGLAVGLALAAFGSAAAAIPGIVGLVAAALLIGCGVGVITPIGFTYLTITTPKERLGQTLGAAEVGRELGDAGGPLLVGALAAATTLTPALLIVAGLLIVTVAAVVTPAAGRSQ
jgi:MFS family permease